MHFFRLLAVLCCCAMVIDSALAQEDATAGLYVCQGSDGVKNIVNKPTGANCQPYRKGILTGGASASPPTPIHQTSAPPLQSAPTLPNVPQAGGKTAPPLQSAPTLPNVLQSGGKTAPPLQPAPTLPNAPESGGKTAPPPQLPQPENLFPPASNFTGTGTGELYQLLGISKPEPIIPSRSTTGKQIWMCPQSNGTPIIVESETPLSHDCQPLGRTQTASKQAASLNRGKPLVGKATTTSTTSAPQNGETAPADGAIAVTTSPPQNIYKCFDDKGKANYVGENQKDQFKNCEFFSRSFAQVHSEFIQQATTPKTLATLAAAGVQQNNAAGVIGLQCIGAGTVEFNGQSRKFNCATRSFDYTPGTSGGNVRLGDKQAAIAAHNLNYLNDKGSCGGKVTSENGRVFHLEPTKDCPQAFIIQAEKIRVQVERHLSINTSGAFRQRQQALAAQINEIAREVGVDPFLVHAVISAESAYKTRARSHAGARGLMQLMPATARRFGVSDSYHTGQNIRGGTTYLKYLLKLFKGNMELAIAAYNAGEGNVRKYGNRIPPFIETRAYVPKVLQYYRRYRSNPSEVGL